MARATLTTLTDNLISGNQTDLPEMQEERALCSLKIILTRLHHLPVSA